MAVQLPKAIIIALAFFSIHAVGRTDILSPRMYIPKRCPEVSRVVQSGFNVECKTCPYSLCTNKAVYETNAGITVNGWTAGSSINCDDTWFKTTDDCYVHNRQLMDEPADVTSRYCDLGYVRRAIALESATTVADTPCHSQPGGPQEGEMRQITYTKDVDLNLICHTGTWYKTTNNCFVEGALLDGVPEDPFPECGPTLVKHDTVMQEADRKDKICPPKKARFKKPSA